jgi:hypothetical protein
MNYEILRGVYPERTAEILRCGQDDSEWAQNDSEGARPQARGKP